MLTPDFHQSVDVSSFYSDEISPGLVVPEAVVVPRTAVGVECEDIILFRCRVQVLPDATAGVLAIAVQVK